MSKRKYKNREETVIKSELFMFWETADAIFGSHEKAEQVIVKLAKDQNEMQERKLKLPPAK